MSRPEVENVNDSRPASPAIGSFWVTSNRDGLTYPDISKLTSRSRGSRFRALHKFVLMLRIDHDGHDLHVGHAVWEGGHDLHQGVRDARQETELWNPRQVHRIVVVLWSNLNMVRCWSESAHMVAICEAPLRDPGGRTPNVRCWMCCKDPSICAIIVGSVIMVCLASGLEATARRVRGAAERSTDMGGRVVNTIPPVSVLYDKAPHPAGERECSGQCGIGFGSIVGVTVPTKAARASPDQMCGATANPEATWVRPGHITFNGVKPVLGSCHFIDDGVDKLLGEFFALAVRPRIFGDAVVPAPDKPACKLLFSVLQTSPHLTFLIRCLHVRLEQTVLARLYALHMHMPNLQELALIGDPGARHTTTAKAIAFPAAASLLGLPTIRRLSLVSLRFRHMYDLDRLFEKRTTEFDSLVLDTVAILSEGGLPISPRRIKTNSLCIRDPKLEPPWDFSERFQWLLRPMCCLDLTGLRKLDYDGTSLFYSVSELLIPSRSTLKIVTISTGNRWDFDRRPPRMTLGNLHALTHLTMNTSPEYMRTKLASVAAVFRSASVEHLVVNVRCSSAYGDGLIGVALRRLISTVNHAAFPRLRAIELNIASELFEASIPPEELESSVRAILVNCDMIGELRIGRLCVGGNIEFRR
ncbi:hypothetical protein DFH06DRAFT_1446222 [Mycena polygramma]|nr:hypothetical protein DFH06DRAFT_1446222 [Mycena polygramma]